MRLLNATSLKLQGFFDDSLPPYAILSHRWQDDEVSFQDMQTDSARQKAGYAKLKLWLRSSSEGRTWLRFNSLVDTCCIDKSSSAELSESINSMYRWYQGAAACYAYLFDVQNDRASFSISAWFTRGWTLQELVAPARVEFYSSTWDNLGTKADLKDEISAITGIDVEVLEGADPARFCVAKRMSWASQRKTTRIEDRAYSLLGIFDVNMPMLYGEGEKAFLRLQDEIMKHSDDNSLFSWSSTDDNYRGLLAKSPSDFSDCANIVLSKRKLNRAPYSITNMGLKIQLPMVAWAMNTYLAALDCEIKGYPNSRVGIFLKLLQEKDQCARIMFEGKDRKAFDSALVSQSSHIEIYVRQRVPDVRPKHQMGFMYGFWLQKLPWKVKPWTPLLEHSDTEVWDIDEVISHNTWKEESRFAEIPVGSSGTAVAVWYRHIPTYKYGLYSVLKLGFDTSFNPVCQLQGAMWGLEPDPPEPR
ncbi:Vegetative incompatibility protein HET-E-1 [Lachnellula arida]|uniref:Vegetative incompatibility protein HET-E-1 n=1 Tax=Lachnellula arida TaxID=1316785 RepID=A0A8T9B6H5_9HELO|nr:Vegetative incompatibility protein HET-E-1 [Lachnellula arida]